MNKQRTHCCQSMTDHLECGEIEIIYTPKFREYGVLYQDGRSSQLIKFCPWCGKELPSSLRNRWFDELDKLGLEPEDDLPLDLNSDAWWKAVNIK